MGEFRKTRRGRAFLGLCWVVIGSSAFDVHRAWPWRVLGLIVFAAGAYEVIRALLPRRAPKGTTISLAPGDDPQWLISPDPATGRVRVDLRLRDVAYEADFAPDEADAHNRAVRRLAAIESPADVNTVMEEELGRRPFRPTGSIQHEPPEPSRR